MRTKKIKVKAFVKWLLRLPQNAELELIADIKPRGFGEVIEVKKFTIDLKGKGKIRVILIAKETKR